MRLYNRVAAALVEFEVSRTPCGMYCDTGQGNVSSTVPSRPKTTNGNTTALWQAADAYPVTLPNGHYTPKWVGVCAGAVAWGVAEGRRCRCKRAAAAAARAAP